MTFDSDVLVWYSRGNPKAIGLVDAVSPRAISVVTLLELFQGVRHKAEMKAVKQMLATLQFRIFPLSEEIGHIAAGLMEEYTLPHGLQLADALIAATAIQFSEVLITGNARHFRPIRRLAMKIFHPLT